MVSDASKLFIFDAPLERLLQDAELCLRSGAANEGECVPSHEKLSSQMGVLSRLVQADKRSFTSAFSFHAWAEEAELEKAELAKKAAAVAAAAAAATQAASVEEEQQEEQSQGAAITEAASRLEKQPSSAEELCATLDAHQDDKDELQRLVRMVEDRLEAKKSDGAFIITKATGRQKLQHKLKRVKAHLAQAQEQHAASEKVVEHSTGDTQQPKAAIEYDEADEHARFACGCGALDADGYHGTWYLPSAKQFDYSKYQLPLQPEGGRTRVFACFPRGVVCPPAAWCTSLRPDHYCRDFKEVGIGGAEGVRLLSCWGHDQRRPGQQIPSRYPQQRLWKLRPSDITFSQDSVGAKFKDGQTLQDTLEKLRSRSLKVEDIEKIKITWHSHWKVSPTEPRWWTFTGNRRLTIFQILEREGKLDSIVVEVVTEFVPEWRVSTQKAGETPHVRGKAVR